MYPVYADLTSLLHNYFFKKVQIDDKKIFFKKKAKKGTYTFKVTVAGNEIYRETTKTITITVN